MAPSILPTQVKGEGMSFAILINYVSGFVIVQSFPVLESLFGLSLLVF